MTGGASTFTLLDWSVLLAYFAGVMALGFCFWRRNRTAEQFTAGGRSMSGWLCGLSIFATYVSSISYLALPGKAFTDNWNPFVFSLAIPLAAMVAVRFYVPLYRQSREVSAYSLLERRFGLWARLFASGFYLLFQIARTGVVMYLMSLPMSLLFGWDIRFVILVTGVLVTAYSFVGGIVAVIWCDAVQAVVLLVGALLALAILMSGSLSGPADVWTVGVEGKKFSLGSPSILAVSQPTIWVVFAYGVFENLRNFGIDQSYVQRYIAAGSDREATRSVWIGALLYVPVSALFLLIGTSLFAFYERHPEELAGVGRLVAAQKLMQEGVSIDAPDYSEQLEARIATLPESDLGDRAFPHFIATQLPQGVRGLLIAAIFAAAMSTVSTSLNSAATLVMSDFYQRLIDPECSDAAKVHVLRATTVAWGLMGTTMALSLVSLTDSVLDLWWMLSSILGAGILGLFLLGIMMPSVRSRTAAWILAAGMGLIAWMTVSRTNLWSDFSFPTVSPFHPYLVIVVGPLFMIALGWIVSRRASNRASGASLSSFPPEPRP